MANWKTNFSAPDDIKQFVTAHTTAHLFVINILHPTSLDSINESSSGAHFNIITVSSYQHLVEKNFL